MRAWIVSLGLCLLVLPAWRVTDAQELIDASRWGSTGDDGAAGLALDADGNVYVSGWFNGSVDFDPGPAIQNQTSVGGDDIFISKFDHAGRLGWTRQMGRTPCQL